ncbi:MAG: hypothetical protein L0Z70_05825 [Chloroflexi bacterium]|nr:hypothetical protein [Chloroflexota bacterium]
MRTIRSSEIGAYLYCHRAWWYRKTGHTPDNQAEMAAGETMHARHGRAALSLGCLRAAAYLILLTALLLAAMALALKAV